jgi:predicted O-methyltransferase YrrM
VIEIGMSVGVSTLAILSGLADSNGPGRVISIDPYGDSSGEESLMIAMHNIQKSGLSDRHTHIRQPSWAALPDLIRAGQKCDLIYIDGMHSFEYVLTDFFFAHKLLRVNGIVGFNDAGWYSVHRVIRFLQTNRKYLELDVGLPRRYDAASFLRSLGKRLQGRPSNDRYFRKLSDFEPASWQYFSF